MSLRLYIRPIAALLVVFYLSQMTVFIYQSAVSQALIAGDNLMVFEPPPHCLSRNLENATIHLNQIANSDEVVIRRFCRANKRHTHCGS